MPRTRQLDEVEIRVLGALLEKQQATPESYPLTTVALIAACNQKTNREPVTQLTETQVVEALDRLREDVLVWRNEGARSERWSQRLDRRWELDPPAKAVMTLLLLRGPQTSGELRTRSHRLHELASVEAVEATLERLSRGFDALVRQLPRQPGQREARWMHLAGDEAVMAAAAPGSSPGAPATGGSPAAHSAAASSSATATSTTASPAATARPRPDAASTAARLDRLEAAVRALEATVEGLGRELHALRADLGEES